MLSQDIRKIANDIMAGDIFEEKVVNTQDEARQEAIDWQHWMSNQNLSYAEMADWAEYFEGLADKFDLREEFEENGII